MTIISSKDSISHCDLKLPEVCDVIKNVLRTGHFFVTLSSVILDVNFYPVIKVSHATGYFYR